MSSVPGPGEPPFRRVAVVGLGVMGGSLARALSALDGVEVHGWSPEAGEREAALRAAAVARAPSDLAAALDGAELVVLAVPLRATRALLATVGGLAPEAVLTDVASLKAPVLDAAREAGLETRWVGGHPMAGSEESGFDASRPDLYRDARVWTVADGAAEDVQLRIADFWRSVGARPRSVDAGDHDRLMALASHLPQLTANALATVLGDQGVVPAELGPGGRDMTRLAASSTTMWRDLLREAPPELPRSLRRLARTLEEMAEGLEVGEAEAVVSRMERTRAWSRS